MKINANTMLKRRIEQKPPTEELLILQILVPVEHTFILSKKLKPRQSKSK